MQAGKCYRRNYRTGKEKRPRFRESHSAKKTSSLGDNMKPVKDWDKYPNFSKIEFDCSHTGRNEMDADFMDMLQAVRTEYGLPMYITSGFRDPSHPVEARKSKPGEHTLGLACDVGIYGSHAVKLLEVALRLGIPRIGVKQKGPVSSRFIHLGAASSEEGFSSPWIWSY